MHVAIDTNCILPGKVGGIENYTIGLIEALQRADSPAAELLLLTRPENHSLFAPMGDVKTAIEFQERPMHNGRPVANWSEVMTEDPKRGRAMLDAFQRRKAEVLRKVGCDLVHFPGNTINPLDLEIPTVLNLHDLQHRHYPQYFSNEEIDNRETWWRASADRADALIAASDFVKDDLVRQWHIDPAKIFVTPDPVEKRFEHAPSEAAIAETRDRLKLPKRFFFYPAATWPHKNHERLIRAFAAARIPEIALVLTGGGQETSNLPTLIDSADVRDRVLLLGRVSSADLHCLYHLATALVFPSQHESWSIPIMEAMASGCPVASSNVTSLPEEVGGAGLLFDPDDTAGMVLAMSALATDPELRREMARRGKARAKMFTVESFLGTLARAYQHAARSRAGRKAA